MPSFDKTKSCLGFIYGNRDFFPDQLVTEAPADLARFCEQTGLRAIQLGEQDSKLGGVETLADARKCAELFKRHADELVGRPSSMAAVETASRGDGLVFLVTQRRARQELEGLYARWEEQHGLLQAAGEEGEGPGKAIFASLAASPVRRESVALMRAPVLVVHGHHDTQVPSLRLVAPRAETVHSLDPSGR